MVWMSWFFKMCLKTCGRSYKKSQIHSVNADSAFTQKRPRVQTLVRRFWFSCSGVFLRRWSRRGRGACAPRAPSSSRLCWSGSGHSGRPCSEWSCTQVYMTKQHSFCVKKNCSEHERAFVSSCCPPCCFQPRKFHIQNKTHITRNFSEMDCALSSPATGGTVAHLSVSKIPHYSTRNWINAQKVTQCSPYHYTSRAHRPVKRS